MSTHDDDFWGDEATWSSRTTPNSESTHVLAASDADVGGDHTGPIELVRHGWNRLLSSGANATREHGIVRPATVPQDVDDTTSFGRNDDTTSVRIDDVPAPTWDATMFDDIDMGIEPVDMGIEPVDVDVNAAITDHEFDDQAGLDPTVARLGAFAVIATLLIPLIFGFGSGGDDDDAVQTPTETPTLAAVFAVDGPTAGNDDVSVPEPATTVVESSPADTSSQQPAATQPASTSGSSDDANITARTVTLAPLESKAAPVQQVDDAADATDATPASRLVRNCAVDYDVVAGDFWIRIADGAGVELAELLDANGASTNTPLFPGGSVCLPAGSTVPAPPTTVAAPATTVPSTSAPSTAAPTTQATTTTTTAPAAALPTSSNASAEQVKQIIRDVWPDELEERAIEIAFRESRFVPTARNFCCHGVFQIYFSVHKSWLSDLGITSINGLYDPAANTSAAYALYQRAGGWGPWGF